MSRRKSRFRSRPSSSPSAPRAERAPREPAAPVAPVDLANQYRYVIGDLQRVGIIAALLIGAMILLRIFVIK
jgi:hypothetical protein